MLNSQRTRCIMAPGTALRATGLVCATYFLRAGRILLYGFHDRWGEERSWWVWHPARRECGTAELIPGSRTGQGRYDEFFRFRPAARTEARRPGAGDAFAAKAEASAPLGGTAMASHLCAVLPGRRHYPDRASLDPHMDGELASAGTLGTARIPAAEFRARVDQRTGPG